MKRFCAVAACVCAWLAIGANAGVDNGQKSDDDALRPLDELSFVFRFLLRSGHADAPAAPRAARSLDDAAAGGQTDGPRPPAEDTASDDAVRQRAYVADGCLIVHGTPAGSQIALRLRAGIPNILEVDFGNQGRAVLGFDRSQFNCITINAGGGDDVVTIDETNGVFTDTETTTVSGGDGNDTFFGGSGGETFVGGDGADSAILGAGNDSFMWNPGDGSDFIEGGAGTDTVTVNGGDGDEQFTVTANGTRVRFDRLSPTPFFLDIGTCENLVLNANGGNDSLACTGNLAALIKITADGGPGDDTLLGTNGVDVLVGGDGNDFIDGQQGNDTAFLGAGDDVFQWDPGDGSDIVEGQDGGDTLRFNGSSGAEIFDLSANGSRVRFTRNIASVVMDLDGVEALELNALGNTDTVTINDLSATDMTEVRVDLAGTLGGAAGDGLVDQVFVNGTSGDDIVTATLPGGRLRIAGLSPSLTVEHFDLVVDTVRMQVLAGEDVIDASAVGSGGPALTLDGGPGDDILLGGVGSDTILGGENDDILIGGAGLDVLDGGTGDDFIDQGGNNVTSGVVTVFGDDADNTIVVSRDGGGNILSNGAPIPGATIANTALIRVFGRGGNDAITLDQSQGALPAAALYGGAGDDTITGGSGNDLLFGGSDNDTLLAKGGFDFLFGGAGNDTMTGGDADDQVFGLAGNDEFTWNPGDDTDLNEGGSGVDTVEVNGGGGAEVFTTTANGTRVRFDRLDPAPFSIDIGTCEELVLNANGGNDAFSCTGNLAALIKITADGGPGDDTLLGSNGADVLFGGDDNDLIDGQQGNDVAFLGAGDDVLRWDPGDGSDTVEGQDGSDTLLFNGSGGAEIFEVSAIGSRVRFTRNLAAIVMDLNGVEALELNALGNTDTVTVNDLSGTDLAEINVDLAGTLGGSTGDAAADTIIVNGTSGDDSIDVFGAGTSFSVLGLTAEVNVTNSEGALDALVINALGGEDGVTATTLPAGVVKLTIDGGADDDSLLGSQGADVFLGGAGDDFIFGDNGDDLALMGADSDVFQWNPGDGNDTLEGQDGADTLLFFGSNTAENVDIVPNGARVLLVRNVGSVTMDLDDVETIDYRALGGADNVVLGDMSGTDLTALGLDLRGSNGGGDGAADTITVNGTQAADVFGAAGDAAGVLVFGLKTKVNIFFQEQALDRLVLNGQGEDDLVDAASLEADGIQLTMNGGLGDDVLLGSAGGDLVNGGDGADVALMGAGDDTFVWNPGDDNDTVEGQAGHDVVQFNGANVAEKLTFSASGSRLLFTRDVAGVVLDANDLEQFDLRVLGGADLVTVNDLTGTDVTLINVDLAGTLGGSTGDAQPDSIIVNGTPLPDTIHVAAVSGAVEVSGLTAKVRIAHPEAANDKLTVNGLGGFDTITAGPGVGSLIALTINQ